MEGTKLKGVLTRNRAMQVVNYDLATGLFARREIAHPKDKVGDAMGTKARSSIMVGIDRRQYQAARLAVFMQTGETPKKVFHVNGDVFNNAWSNLRFVSESVEVQAREDIPVEILAAQLNYNPSTGVITRKVRTAKTLEGEVAGHVNSSGYWSVSVLGRSILAHRIAWAMGTGTWPTTRIDHINRNRIDNRICNLRIASASENNMNSKLRKNSSTGVKGVYYNKNNANYRARVQRGGEVFEVGSFSTIEEADEMVKKARETIHKEFCNHG